MTEPKSEAALAVHQAAHAVLAFAFKIGLREIAIDSPCDKHLCGLGLEWLDDAATSRGRRPAFEDWDRVRGEIVVVLAGSIAEELAGAEPNAESAAYDEQRAASLAWLVCHSDDEFDAMSSWVRIHTRWHVTAGRELISAVAEALTTRGRLNRKELETVVLTPLAGRRREPC